MTDLLIPGLAIIIVVLLLVCITLLADNKDLKDSLNSMKEMYRTEANKNIEMLAKKVFKDDLEILEK
jgi:hypothetical protein